MRRGMNLLLAIFLLGCTACTNNLQEKHYDAKKNVVDVSGQLHEIHLDSIFVSNQGKPYILNNYLLIKDYDSYDHLIYVFDKRTFTYLASTGTKGQGPGEIANMGELIPNAAKDEFYVFDHGKQVLFSFSMDSVLQNPAYLPQKKAEIDPDEFPIEISYVNDTLSYAQILHVLNYNDYKPLVAKWNLLTNERQFFPYEGHPAVERKRTSFAASPQHNRYVEGYWYHDLLTIGTLDGELIHNVYGKEWDANSHNGKGYFESRILFAGDKIISGYLAEERLYEVNGQVRGKNPTKLIIFDLDGNHLKTLETHLPINDFCYDTENNRLILIFNDEMQFAYLDLENVI